MAALNQSAAIAGLGGIGKTQTAVEYAYRWFYDEPIYEWVFWVKADTALNAVTDLAEVGRSLLLSGNSLNELAEQVRRWLETHDRWLLIFDNADQPELLKSILPRQRRGRILLTSRAQRFVSLGINAPMELQALTLGEAIAFLCQRTKQSLPIRGTRNVSGACVGAGVRWVAVGIGAGGGIYRSEAGEVCCVFGAVSAAAAGVARAAVAGNRGLSGVSGDDLAVKF